MKSNIKKPEYDKSILSISSSLLKYYNISSHYESLGEIDDKLKKGYKNVIFLILDCLGSNIMNYNLKENSFLRKNTVAEITSVYPPTTAAATIAFHSGLSPYENGWIGWMPYFKEYDSIIELFSGKDYYSKEQKIELPEKNILKYKSIYERICENNPDVKYHKLFPNFVENGSNTFEELCDKINNICSNNTKNIISAYWNEPDHTVHLSGIESNLVKDVLQNIDNELSELSKKISDSIIIISADHGAINVKNVYLNEIKEINDCLEMPPSIESRFISFFIKKGMKNKFVKALEQRFKEKYLLFTKEEFLKSGLLGQGKRHDRINDYLGDFVMIVNSNLNFLYYTDENNKKNPIADHGGITKEEMMVPVIVIECK